MIFARTEDGTPAGRPRLLLLIEEAGTPGQEAEVASAAEAAGLAAFLVPWTALEFRLDGVTATAGQVWDGTGHGGRPLAPEERLAPDAIAPLTELPDPAAAVAARIARLHPDAVLGLVAVPPAWEGAPEGVVALAPLVARPLPTDGDAGARRLRTFAEHLVAVPPGMDLSPIEDPRRVVLPMLRETGRLTCGFAAAPGTPFRRDLFEAWLGLARGRMPPSPTLLLAPPPGAAADRAAHPLAAVLPCLAAGGHAVVRTRERADASFAHLDPALRLKGGADETALLRWLGRTIDPAAPAGPESERLVEPGVGRTFLLDRLSLADRPDLVDFTATGIGVTPYAEGGYVNVGRSIDGMAGLERSQHRRRCADRLEEAGCRAGRVVAVVALADSAINVAHAKMVPAGIAVRAFRCVLRVKQLDPVVPFLHSHPHAPEAHAFLLHPGWSRLAATRMPGPGLAEEPFGAAAGQALLAGLDGYALECSLGSVVDGVLAPPAWPGRAAALARRWAAVRMHAPSALDLARRRLARELGRDPERERPGPAEYAQWFARTMGCQLGAFFRLRFLHEYNQPGTARWTPSHIPSLGENNVTLLAEFPDLDTGIFVDAVDEATLDALFLRRADAEVLRAGFEGFHRDDVARAREVVRVLACVALAGDTTGVVQALGQFDAAYAAERDAQG